MSWVRIAGPCSLLVFGVAGCTPHPTIKDNSKLWVEPGVGISNVCELGMTVKEVRTATSDLQTYGINDREWFWKQFGASRFALMQSLGAIAPVEPDRKIRVITFYVVPYDSDISVPGLIITNPFRGKVGDKLSFNGGPVSRSQVESGFGAVEKTVTNLSDGVELAKRGTPFLFRSTSGNEKIYYRHKGIDFEIVSNCVTSFSIYGASGTNPQGPPQGK